MRRRFARFKLGVHFLEARVESRFFPPLNISDNVANMLDGLLGWMPLWAHLNELALSDSLLLVLLCPRLES